MLRILLIDDHETVRQGLQTILRAAFGEMVCGEARNAREALERSAEGPWDLVVLDVALPDGCGLDILKDLRQRCRAPVLVLSIYSDAVYARSALKAGAMGYITKQGAPEELVDAARCVLTGGRYVTAAVADEVLLHPYKL